MIVCHCFGVTDSTLKKLIVEEGAKTAAAIARRTGAGSCCAPCREEITALLYSLDREVRRTAWESYADGHLAHKNTLAACLEDYFMRSEQLPTRLFIRTGDVDGKPAAGGMLLQVMPAQNAQQDDFDHLATLTETIKTEELLTLPANEVLWRLYHEEEVTVYDPQDVEFKCTCSRERCADALKTLPDEEVDSILAEDGEIDMHCDYCGNHYLFNAMDIAEIRNNASPADPQVH